MHAPSGVPDMPGGLVTAAQGDPEPHMPNTAEVEPRMTSNGALRTRKRRDDLKLVLEQLVYNLRGSWDPPTTELFQALGPEPWSRGHNPVHVLKSVDNDVLAEHAESILARGAELEQYLTNQPALGGIPRVAYFSAEFAIAEALPIYPGGLGVLAGDHLKSASDLGLPLVGVGLMYREGYFRQYLNVDGWQQESYPENDFFNLPLIPETRNDGTPLLVSIPLPGREIWCKVWRIQVGRIPLYLLDTNITQNTAEDRQITG